jgi:hypothetical protein
LANPEEKSWLSEVGSDIVEGVSNAASATFEYLTTAESPLEELLNDEGVLEGVLQNAQTFLTLNYDQFASRLTKRILEDKKGFKNFGLMLSDPAKMVNYLTPNPAKYQQFMGVTPVSLSKLIASVRLFKTKYDENGKEIDNFEIRFDEFTDPAAILENKLSRGSGIGLVSFDWSYTGTNPFESTNLIEAELKLRLNSAEDLNKEYLLTSFTTNEVEKFKIIDLVVPRADEEYDPNVLSYKAVVGWGPNFTPEGKEEEQLKKELLFLRRTLILTRTSHDIEFRQNGVVELTLGFQARMDTTFDTRENDILRLMGTDLRKVEDLINDASKELKKLESNCDSNKVNKTEYQSLREAFDKQVKELEKNKALVYKRLLDTLIANNKVYVVDVPLEYVGIIQDDNGEYKTLKRKELGSIVNQLRGSFDRVSNVNNVSLTFREYTGLRRRLVGENSLDLSAVEADYKKEVIKCISSNANTFEIPYIYLGDIIDAALEPFGLEDNPYNKDMRILLGTGVVEEPFKQPSWFMLSHLPISLDLFMDWFIDTIYKPQKSFFPLKEFLTSVTTRLASEAVDLSGLNSTAVPSLSRNFITTSFEAPPELAENDVIMLMNNSQINSFWDSLESAALVKRQTQFYLLTSKSTVSVSDKSGMAQIKLGMDRGLVKKIDYTRREQPFLREVAMTYNNETNSLSRIAEPYTAKISMVGNNLFYPGQTIYLEPTPFFKHGTVQSSDGNWLKIRGVYFIVSVRNYIAAGKFETEISAEWIGWGDTASGSLILGSQEGSGCHPLSLQNSVQRKLQEASGLLATDSAKLTQEKKSIDSGPKSSPQVDTPQRTKN